MEKIGEIVLLKKSVNRDNLIYWGLDPKENVRVGNNCTIRHRKLDKYILSLSDRKIEEVRENFFAHKYDMGKYNTRIDVYKDNSLNNEEKAVIINSFEALKVGVVPICEQIKKDASHYENRSIYTIFKNGIIFETTEDELRKKITTSLFYSINDAKNKCREIRDKYKVGDIVSDEDFNWLINNRFKYHSNWKSMNEGRILLSISVEKESHNTICFGLNFNDNESTIISFINGYADEEKEIKKAVLCALREADFSRRKAFKDTFLNIYGLPYTYVREGETHIIESQDDIHVDHYDSDFAEAVSEWISKNGGYDEIYPYVNKIDYYDDKIKVFVSKYEFIDREIEESARDFIASHTKLRILHKTDNLTRSKKRIEIEIFKQDDEVEDYSGFKFDDEHDYYINKNNELIYDC